MLFYVNFFIKNIHYSAIKYSVLAFQISLILNLRLFFINIKIG